MASSSRSINHNQFLKYIIDEEKGPNPKGATQEEIEEEEDDDDNEEEEDDLLQLKLGSGSAATLCRKTTTGDNNGESNPVVQNPRSGSSLLGLGLGLKLWPNMELQQEEGSEMVVGVKEVARRFIGRLPSWQIMASQDYWYHKPTDPHVHHSHHYPHKTNPHHSGLWFTLHSSTNQRGEAFPQVPKAYIRVKNHEMTIFMVKKYLVTKLGLFNENEVDILCMGQRLLNVQSLKVVRDTIWIPALVDSLNSASKSLADSFGMPTSNLMPLLYQKHIISSNNSNDL